ncbi:daunorubicin resistance protein DrrA family ABC transporter ATP-binding protein [Lentzea sp. NBRC 105346]|uniref:ATP-binding cassette domain-containing protein n=1 Tax=Lentzea sp. NBRC 105346 TaxID=3032205 RepID=UPI0024A0322C|nr:ATP-binding cassette domain-containing protein [Lentzea sp. NBRC 105346]GLZ32187.1 daunorubicin resistance protein DrrA family ABC transporter ATP-binding protein [Lentzea sp. NBRC 105346]
MDYAIQAEGLRKRYGDTEAVAGVDLAVPTGTITGVLGPNGAGKTTTVRMLATLLRPDGGRAEICGFDVVRQAREVRHRIGLTGQYAAVDQKLTGRENLQLIGVLQRLGRRNAKQRAAELLERFDLTEAADRLSGTYSGGMRRRLDLAASLIADPAVLFLDEPTTGLDPVSRLDLWAMIRAEVDRGLTVLLTTQYLEEADQLADRIAVVDKGVVIAGGTPEELKRQVGEERLDVTLAHVTDGLAVANALSRVSSSEPTVSPDGRTVSLTLAGGVLGISTAVSALHDAGVEIVDLAVRRPTLDDVFIALTGNRQVEPTLEKSPA